MPAIGFLGPGLDSFTVGTGLLSGAVSAFLITFVIGALAIAVAPRFTEGTMSTVVDDPVGSFVYGLVFLVALAFLTVVLVLTILGIFLAIPLILLAVALWGVGAAIAYLTIGDRLVGHDAGWLKPLLVGAAINGVLTLSGIGGVIAFLIGATGFGAILRSLLG